MMAKRRDRRVWYIGLLVFVAVFLFTFLVQNEVRLEVGAASLKNFDAGYIISDYQMGNYKSMTEAEIQTFLTKKNPCSNTDKSYYDSLVSKYKTLSWHFENGHFVCLSEELFGDGISYGKDLTKGKGETAAHIIWQAAQDYKINPQVLIVLLEKEQSLITDTYPNNVQYRSATGYGCPDTAPCAEQYYGFKNQVRKAAALFRTVLDGGWTNYPLGNNYIQYNPSASCGGSVVNIKNLATSALYRYTPYQPNAATLAAGYGTAECGAYGNRNFYLYFQDWFGGIMDEGTVGKATDSKADPKGESTTSGGTKEKAESAINERAKKATVLGKVKNKNLKSFSGGYYKEFEKGYIYWTEKTGAWDISGGILATWKTGNVSKDLGYPTSSEMVNKSGMVYQTFENGSIYWDVKTGGWPIRSFAEARWLAMGGFNSKLGKFVNSGYCGLANKGCYQAFETGNIYWTEKTGAWDVSGGIYQTYFNEGTEWGKLGYPTSSEMVNKSGMVYQTFENGSIYWDVKTGGKVKLAG